MNLAHVLPWISRKGGGPFYAVSGLAKMQTLVDDMRVEVFGSQDGFEASDLRQWQPLTVHAAPVIGPRRLCYAPALKKMITAFGPDLIHSATVWTWPAALINELHGGRGIPFIASTHGTLDSWALRHSHWRKALALWLFQRKHFDRATCIHALNESERISIRAFGLKNPVCVIPNGVELPQEKGENGDQAEKGRSLAPALRRRIAGRKVLLYLGRLHPKKGLIDLVHAWAAIRAAQGRYGKIEDWVLVVAGWDEMQHEKELRELTQERGLQDRVLFPGPQFGPDRDAWYRACDAFVLPSFSEGLPMVVLEAWAHGKPVVMTPECNLPEGFVAGAAIGIQHGTDTAGIEKGLRELLQARAGELEAMGARGRALVEERFTWSQIARTMKSVYDWILGGGPPPDCLQLSTPVK